MGKYSLDGCFGPFGSVNAKQVCYGPYMRDTLLAVRSLGLRILKSSRVQGLGLD